MQHYFEILGNYFIRLIIVGGGSGGAVLASRLSEIFDFTVLLLEAGGPEPVTSTVPWFHSILPGSSLDWKFRTVPQKDILLGYQNQVITLNESLFFLLIWVIKSKNKSFSM